MGSVISVLGIMFVGCLSIAALIGLAVVVRRVLDYFMDDSPHSR